MNLPFSPNMIDELKALLELGQSLEVEIAELDQLEKKFYTFVFLEKGLFYFILFFVFF